eukprot:SAG25_NODE_486_length_7469_cov_4.137449_11_plen_57_part_00
MKVVGDFVEGRLILCAVVSLLRFRPPASLQRQRTRAHSRDALRHPRLRSGWADTKS